ncbi:MAG TPA: hypothetical protein VEX60_04330, partial [Pyrinomonadaceae bacterium]|nr:hypothetical protein [Pyrinomonadaceae bacterium]
LTIVIALVAGLAGQLIYGGLVSPRTAEARAGDDESRLQWEYCAVTKAQFAATSRGGIYWIAYFKSNGNVDVATIETGPTGNAFSRAVARLGEDGWDMVGEGPLEIRPGQPGGTPTAIFFKRRKD